jgi:4-hydroxybenzoate polyprenyltransferase
MKYLKLIRFKNLVVMVLIQYLIRFTLIIPSYSKENVLSEFYFALLLFSILLIVGAGYTINDYFDIKVDSENKDEHVIVGRTIKRRIALVIHLILTSVGLILGFYIAYKINQFVISIILIVCAYILWVYNLKLKRIFFLANIIVAGLSAIFVTSIAILEILLNYNHKASIDNITTLTVIATFAFILSLMHEIIKDIKTGEGDEKFMIKTLPTEWGLLKTKEFLKWLSIITAFIISVITITKFKTNITATLYAFILLIGPLFLLNIWVYKAQNTMDFERISKLNKFIIFAGIMSMLFLI